MNLIFLRKIKLFLFSHLIPPSLRFGVINLKMRFLGHNRRYYYSQYGEDVVLASIFKNQEKGFYVDVGAHHPARYSNTRLLHERGWRGMNIDANPGSIRLFQRDRPWDINIASGIAEQEGVMIYWMFSDPAVNTFSERDAEKWLGKKWIRLLKKEPVIVAPLKEVLEKFLSPDTNIDLLNIDAEGLDFQVLRSNDWAKFCPKVIVIEAQATAPHSQHLMSFLEERGYRLYTRMGLSLIFVSAGIKDI